MTCRRWSSKANGPRADRALQAPDAALFDAKDGTRGGVYGASSGFFHAIGIRLLAGRGLTDDESFAAAPVGVINESAARVICGGIQNRLGRVVHARDE